VTQFRWQTSCGLGLLLAGGWSLPLIAAEEPQSPATASVPDNAVSQPSPTELLSGPSGAIAPISSPAPSAPLPSSNQLETTADGLPSAAIAASLQKLETALLRAKIAAPLQSDSAPQFSAAHQRLAQTDGHVAKKPWPESPTRLETDDQNEADPSGEVRHQTSASRRLLSQAEAGLQTEGKVMVQAQDDVPLSEDTGRIDQTENILDNSGAPAGDTLEAVDGLDESVVEEADSESAEPPTSPETEASTESEAELQEPDQDAELPEDEFDAEEFDVEEFEAEEFEFDDEDDFASPSETEAENPVVEDAAAEDEAAEGDPDLGILRLRERPLPKKKSKTEIPVFLVGNLGYIGNGNTLAGVDPVDDRLFRSGLSLIASPRLSKRTALIASVQGNLYRYNELSRLDYNELRLQTNLRHVFTRRLYGDLGWTHRQLFLQEKGDRFLYEHAAFVSLTRNDPLTKKTKLTSFYNLRASFADPETSSRLRNTLGISLRHNLTPGLQASLTGRMTLTNFTQQSRQDFYTQGVAQLSYKVSKNVRLGLFGSLTRGNSSNRRVDFDNSTVGVSLSGNVRLF